MTKHSIATISIDYNEFDPSSYRGVTVKLGAKHGMTVNSGVPQDDYWTASLFANTQAEYVMLSSSVDQFMTDGGELDIRKKPDNDLFPYSHVIRNAILSCINHEIEVAGTSLMAAGAMVGITSVEGIDAIKAIGAIKNEHQRKILQGRMKHLHNLQDRRSKILNKIEELFQ